LTSGAIQAEVKNTTNINLVKDVLSAKTVLTINSNNTLTESITLRNPAFENVRVELAGTVTPNGPGNAVVGVELSHGPVLVNSKVDVFSGPVVKSDVSTRFKDFLVGAEFGYDVSTASISHYSASVGIERPREKAVLQLLTGCKSFNAAYYQRFADNLEVAYKSFWSQKALAMEVGAKYYLVGGGFVKAKLDNAGRMGVAIASDLRPGMQLILGATVDTNKLSQDNHKIGLELSYSA
jgi:voltage-dependent anion channel protein 2